MLAINHFNNGIGTIVPELQDNNKKCNVRITTEIFDTREDHEVAVKDVIDSISGERKPCTILGSNVRDVTVRLTSVLNIYDITQISAVAGEATLDRVEDYPLFSRTNPNRKCFVYNEVLSPQFLHIFLLTKSSFFLSDQ